MKGKKRILRILKQENKTWNNNKRTVRVIRILKIQNSKTRKLTNTHGFSTFKKRLIINNLGKKKTKETRHDMKTTES